MTAAGPAEVAHGRAILEAAGVDLSALSDASLRRLERLAEAWPLALGAIPVPVVRAAAMISEYGQREAVRRVIADARTVLDKARRSDELAEQAIAEFRAARPH